MRQFKIKNLLIQVLPENLEAVVEHLAEVDDCTGPCSLQLTDYTHYCCAGGCSTEPSGVCLPCTTITQRGGGRGCSGITKIRQKLPPSLPAATLALLKAELQSQLREVEAHEKLLEERLGVHTQEEANVLEQSLNEALQHIQQLKNDLPK